MDRGFEGRRTNVDGWLGSRWLRLGCLLVVGELVVLMVVASQPGRPASTNPSAERLSASPPDTGGRTRSIGGLRSGVIISRTTTTTLPPAPPPPPPSPSSHVAAPPPAPAAPAAPVVNHGVVPPANPPANIPPSPNFLQSCSGTAYDGSTGCTSAALEAIANARRQEGLGPLALPSNWAALSPERELFVATNLERTARGLPPVTAMVSPLDQVAEQGAAQSTDPYPPSGFPSSKWGSNWAGAVGNPLEAMYFWMYDDGPGSANIECTPSNPRGCWGHRDNVLLALACQVCVAGAGWAPQGYQHTPSMTELLVESSGSPPVDFTWQEEAGYLTG